MSLSCKLELCFAVDAGDFETVVKLVESKSVSVGQRGGYPLKCACQRGHKTIAQYLLSKGVNQESLDCAFINSAAYGQIDMMQLLVSYGADVHCKNDEPMRAACIAGHLNSIQYLMFQQGVKNKDEWGLLSAEYFHWDCLDFFLSLGFNTRAYNDYVFRKCCYAGNLQFVKKFVELGADVGVKDDYGISVASSQGHTDVVAYLLSVGADREKMTDFHKRCFAFFEKMQEKIRHRAANKIYYWIIPILYRPGSISAYNLGMKGYQECFGK